MTVLTHLHVAVWGGLPQHRSRAVREFVAAQGGRLTMEFLSAYAPELNAVEYLWEHWKTHELPTLCTDDLWKLIRHARRAPRRMQRRPPLVAAFWK